MKRTELKRRTPLQSRPNGLSRQKRLKPKAKPRLTARERQEAAEFKAAVGGQPCAVCGTEWASPDAHHVVAASVLRRMGLPVYDTRNALPLCPIGSTGHACHERHENGSRRIPLACLSDDNLNYASSVLGAYAGDYLRRYYGAALSVYDKGSGGCPE